ncbi:MAG: UvrD-helicase domain-containing protein [Bacteroidota bacterium]
MLTPQQEKALDLQRHLSVTANAGSGKTTVLARRFVEILLNTRAEVQNVVAITFTEKAAGELSRRIASEVENQIRQLRAQVLTFQSNGLHVYEELLSRLNRLEQIRSELPSAPISTIHAFCARILRQYPVEAGIDAGFTIGGTLDTNRLIDEAFRKTFTEILCSGDSSAQGINSAFGEKERVLDTLRSLGRRTVEDTLRLALKKRDIIDRLIDAGIFEKTDAELLQFWEEVANGELLSRLRRYHELFSTVISFSTHSRDLRPHLDLLYKEDVGFAARCRALRAIGSALLTADWKSVRKKSFPPDVESSMDFPRGRDLRIEQFVRVLRQFKSLFGGIDACGTAPFSSDRAMLAYTKHLRVILELYKRIRSAFDDLKESEGMLDYEDLLLKTLQLLRRHPEIRQQLSLQYPFIMVDEYQDTDRLQYEVLRPLLDEYRSGNLFIVGDPKQSIFGFRNADVAIFEATKLDIQKAATGNLPPLRYGDVVLGGTELERRGILSLPESFRLLTNLVAFVNHLFRGLLDDPARGVFYEELVRGRANDADGRIELLICWQNYGLDHNNEDEEETSQDENYFTHSGVLSEEETIARRIVSFMIDGTTVWERKADGSEYPRPVQFRDIGILLRNRKRLGKLEDVLRLYKIPYVVSSGVGFYQTQEIYDFANYFRFLLNPADDVALVGILRSPFFTLSDADLYAIAVYGGSGTFYQKLQRYAESETAPPHVRSAAEYLASDLRHAGRLSIPLLVQRLLMQTGWLGAIAGSQRGDQNKANIEKLLRLAREFEGRSFASLFDFVERLNELIEHEPEEGQAPVAEPKNAVQILTIHAAKGMEFPIVILPYLNIRQPAVSLPIVDQELGIGFPIASSSNLLDRADEEASDQKVVPMIVELMKLRALERSAEEEKRVLYVATTRARDHLVLSASIGKRGVELNSPLQWIVDQFQIDLRRGDQDVVLQTQVQRGSHLHPIPHKLVIHCRDAESAFGEQESLGRIKRTFLDEETSRGFSGKIYVDSIPGQIRGEFFSATQIQLFYKSKKQFLESYRTGAFPEAQKLPIVERIDVSRFDEQSDVPELLDPARRGMIIHDVLKHIKTHADIRSLPAIVQTSVMSAMIGSREILSEVTKEILIQLQSLFASSFGEEILSVSEILTEYTIATALGEDFIVGIIDRLMNDPKHRWWILDYKTDNVSSHVNLFQYAVEQYAIQMKCYAYLLHRLHPEQSAVRTVLWFLRRSTEPIEMVFQAAELSTWEAELSQTIRQMKSLILDEAPLKV